MSVCNDAAEIPVSVLDPFRRGSVMTSLPQRETLTAEKELMQTLEAITQTIKTQF